MERKSVFQFYVRVLVHSVSISMSDSVSVSFSVSVSVSVNVSVSIKYCATNIFVRRGNYSVNSQGPYEVARKIKRSLT
jgi:hypothetical protein